MTLRTMKMALIALTMCLAALTSGALAGGTPGPQQQQQANAGAKAGVSSLQPPMPGMQMPMMAPNGFSASSASSSSSSSSGPPVDDCAAQKNANCGNDRSALVVVQCPPSSGFQLCYMSAQFKCFLGPAGKTMSCAATATQGNGQATAVASGGVAGVGGTASKSASAGGQTRNQRRRRAFV